MNFFKQTTTSLLVAAALFLTACGGGGNKAANLGDASKVVIHQLADPQQLNPVNSTDNGATTIYNHLFQSLMTADFQTYGYVPCLVKAKPVVTTMPDGKISYEYEIREEAKWDNGSPITGNDYAFTVKCYKAPKNDCAPLRPYFEGIIDIVVDAANPKKFKVIYNEPYMIAEATIGTMSIIPEYAYDPKGVLKNYTVAQLAVLDKGAIKALENDAKLTAFSTEFNSTKFQREAIVGSGAYSLDKWETNARIILKKKKDWWGEKVKERNFTHDNFPETIIFETINDQITAVEALKSKKLDVMTSIPNKDFVQDLTKNQNFTAAFATHTPPQFAYEYIGLNLRNPKLSDLKVRKALSHLMDVDQLIQSSCYGLGERVNTFIHPSIKKFLNTEIKPYDLNIETAKAMLSEAGWKDTNGNGTVDKIVDGELTELEININYNQGNARREKTCLIFQETARKAGVKINIQPLEWSVFLEKTKKHDFESYVGGWVSSPNESDPKQIWHTSGYNDGSNYVGFGDEKTDKIIMDLRKELDETKRGALYRQLQATISEQAPYIFLIAQKERIAISKKYDNAPASGLRPGYWANGFKQAQ